MRHGVDTLERSEVRGRSMTSGMKHLPVRVWFGIVLRLVLRPKSGKSTEVWFEFQYMVKTLTAYEALINSC